MAYYPLFLELEGRKVVVVGGGAVAERKVISLLPYGAEVTVVSPRLTAALANLKGSGTIMHLQRAYADGDLRGAVLAIGAASDSAERGKDVNRVVHCEALRLGIPVNVVDDPENSTFITPSIVKRGLITVGVSTSGASPTLARSIREGIECDLGWEYEIFADLLLAVRKKLLKNKGKNDIRERLNSTLAASPIPDWIRGGERGKINTYLRDLLGPGYSLSRLGIKGLLPKRAKRAEKGQ